MTDVGTFDTYADLRLAMLHVARQANRQLDLFDPTASDLGLGSVEMGDALAGFLRKPDARLRIVVHDTGWLERDCPRLMQLLRYHSHQIAIHRTLPAAHAASDTLFSADAILLLRRYHKDFPRGRIESAESDGISPWLHRFEAIWEASEVAVSFTTLGL